MSDITRRESFCLIIIWRNGPSDGGILWLNLCLFHLISLLTNDLIQVAMTCTYIICMPTSRVCLDTVCVCTRIHTFAELHLTFVHIMLLIDLCVTEVQDKPQFHFTKCMSSKNDLIVNTLRMYRDN